MKIQFEKRAFGWFVFWFSVEVAIAIFQFGSFIRSYLGDVFVVWLMYYGVTAFLEYPKQRILLGVLVFSYVIEFLQYLRILKQLGLNHNRILNVIVGSSFSWVDIICYSVGVVFLWGMTRKEQA